MITIATERPKRKPGLRPDDTWIAEDEADAWLARGETIEMDREPIAFATDSLEYLEPDPEPIHHAVFFGHFPPDDADLQLIDLRTGRPVSQFRGLRALLDYAREHAMDRFAVKVVG